MLAIPSFKGDDACSCAPEHPIRGAINKINRTTRFVDHILPSEIVVETFSSYVVVIGERFEVKQESRHSRLSLI